MSYQQRDYGAGGISPCGCIQPNKKETTNNTNKAIDNAIRMVRNLAVRLSELLSLIRLNIPAPRLNRMSTSKIRMMSLIIILIIKMLESDILLDVQQGAI